MSFLEKYNNPKKIILKDKEGFSIAILTIADIWIPDFEKEAISVYGTNDLLHPAVNYLVNKIGTLIENREKIKKISINARKFIEDNHNYKSIASVYENKWTNP